MIRRSLLFRLLSLVALIVLVAGEDGSSYTDDAAAAGDDDSWNASNQFEVCTNSDIEVTGLSLLCDSRGTFYYGSGKYRDSETCKAGDKAKLSIYFTILNDLDEIDPLLTLSSSGDYEEVTIYKNARLCYLGTLQSTSGTSCASVGNYSLSTQFYWSKSDDDGSSQSFAPFTTIGFHTEKDPNKYDLGGANTDKCPGNSIITWNQNIRRSGRFSGPVASFIWSFLILLGTFGILGMFAWYLWRRPSGNDSFSRHYHDAIMEDDRKIMLVGSNKGLVAF